MECYPKTPEFPKYSRIPYFSPKVHFYAKQTTQLPYNYSETLKTQECPQNTRILKTYPEMKTHATTFDHSCSVYPDQSISFKNYYLMYTEH